ncbi:unnamed protein product [Rotaria sp. Silwood2]|nr:unnamed protein product [Rotaria sp. Silwood2]
MVLCSVDLFYYSLTGLALYHFIGPWYIGYLTNGYIGAIFLGGTIIRGIYLPPDMQLYVGSVQLVLFFFPLTLCLCASCYSRYILLQSRISVAESQCNRVLRIFTVYILFGYTVLFVLYWSFVSTASYKLAFIISPFGLPLAIFSLFLYVKSKRLKMKDFKIQLVKTDNDNSVSENIIEVDEYRCIAIGTRTAIKDD